MRVTITDATTDPTTPIPDDEAATLRAHLLDHAAAVPTSSLGRLWRAGRSALGMASLLSASRRGDALDAAAVAAVVERLGRMKGLAMKAGQMLGYLDTGLPDAARAMLATLQTAAPTTPFPVVAATLEAALGAAGVELARRLEPVPVAVASVGQVHRGRLADGREVAVKVRHPGVEAAFRADFRTASVGKLVGALAGVGTVRAVIDEARDALLEECDLALEAERQARFAAIFVDDPDIVVPAVVPALCTRDVLVTCWEPGRSLDALLAGPLPQAERDRIGVALFRFWLRTLYRDGLFHADPHPGNFALRADGRVVVYDYGCVRRFEPAQRQGFARLAAATRADDPDAMQAALVALGGRAAKDPAELRRLLRGFFAPLLVPGRRRIAVDEGRAEGPGGTSLLGDKRKVLGLELPGRLLFLFRLRFGLYAVLARLGAEADWAGLERAWADDAYAAAA